MDSLKRVVFRRSWGAVILIIVAQWLPLAGAMQDPENRREAKSVNWEAVKQALEAYESFPSEESAKSLLAEIPEKAMGYQRGRREIVSFALIESIQFEKAVSAGDPLLAEAAFRLLGHMRGGVAEEELRIMLGRFLTKKPEVFLILLNKYLHIFASERDYPINMTEILEIVPDITSSEDSRLRTKEETRLYTERIKALQSVKHQELKELRDACIRVIRAIINEL